MKLPIAFAVVAALTLSACNNAETPSEPAADAAAPADTAAPDTATAPAMGDKPTKEFVVGTWGNDGDCAMAMELKADGTSDGPFGNWACRDGEITFIEAPEMKIAVTVAEDGKNMNSVNAQGGKHQMTRC